MPSFLSRQLRSALCRCDAAMRWVVESEYWTKRWTSLLRNTSTTLRRTPEEKLKTEIYIPINWFVDLSICRFSNFFNFYASYKNWKTVGIVLAILLLLLTLSGSGYFFFTLKVNFVQWLAYNACSPSSLVYLAGFIAFWLTKKSFWLPLAFLPMYYFGTMGLFTFTWNGANTLPNCRISQWHSICYGQATPFIASVITRDLHKGLVVEYTIFVPYIAFVMYYCRTHTQEISNLLQMTP